MAEPHVRIGALEKVRQGLHGYFPACDGTLYIRADLVKPVLEIAARNETGFNISLLKEVISDGEDM